MLSKIFWPETKYWHYVILLLHPNQLYYKRQQSFSVYQVRNPNYTFKRLGLKNTLQMRATCYIFA